MPASHGKDDRRPAAMELITAEIAELHAALDRIGPEQQDALYALATAVASGWQRGGKLLICGNGGSAADSQHIAAELVGRFMKDRQGYPALALTTNSSILTAVANDYGFEQVFARQVEALGRPEDVLLTISTSGRSPNCIEAVAAARRLGMTVAGFLGGDGGELRALLDIAVVAPSDVTPHIQEIHITMGHLLCRMLENWQGEATAPAGGFADD
jgi:D-sedoheptulose 7-phosphate isomerase